MKIAELFVELGVNNAGKVKGELQGVQSGLQKTGDAAFAAKASILGALLGLEELTRRSVGSAVELRMFAGATGESTAALQKWQYLAQMNHVSGEELAGTIRGLQSAQADMAMGKGIPAGALWFGIDMTKKPVEMFEQIAKRLKAIGNDTRQIGIARSMASSLGISDNMFAMLRTGSLSLAAYRKELELTGADIDKLTQVDRAWQQLWYDLGQASKKFVAGDIAEPVLGAVKIVGDAVDELMIIMHKLEAATKQTGKGQPGAKAIPAAGYSMAGGLATIGLAAALGLTPVGWLGGAVYGAGALALGAGALADKRRMDQGKPSVFGEIGKEYDKVGLWQMLNGGSMENRRRMQGAKPGDDMRTGFERFVDAMAASPTQRDFAMAGMLPGAAAGSVTNHIEINLNGVRDAQIPQRTASEVTRALNNLPQRGK